MKYIRGYWNDRLHWACEICIVRPMCQDDKCYMTDYLHELCMDCKIKHICMMDKDCQKIKKYKMWDRIGKQYGKQIQEEILKHFKETSIFYRFMTPNQDEQTDFTWWINED